MEISFKLTWWSNSLYTNKWHKLSIDNCPSQLEKKSRTRIKTNSFSKVSWNWCCLRGVWCQLLGLSVKDPAGILSLAKCVTPNSRFFYAVYTFNIVIIIWVPQLLSNSIVSHMDFHIQMWSCLQSVTLDTTFNIYSIQR